MTPACTRCGRVGGLMWNVGPAAPLHVGPHWRLGLPVPLRGEDGIIDFIEALAGPPESYLAAPTGDPDDDGLLSVICQAKGIRFGCGRHGCRNGRPVGQAPNGPCVCPAPHVIPPAEADEALDALRKP